MNFKNLGQRLSPISTMLIIYAAAIGFAIFLSPQYPVKWQSHYIMWPAVALVVSLYWDLK